MVLLVVDSEEGPRLTVGFVGLVIGPACVSDSGSFRVMGWSDRSQWLGP